MSTPSAKHPSSLAARTQSAPASSNAVATEVDIPFIDGKAYPINKNETMLAFIRYTAGIVPNPVATLCAAPNWNLSEVVACVLLKWRYMTPRLCSE